MKPDIFYGETMLVSSLEEMAGILEARIKPLKPKEPYFEQVSIEKHVVETLLKEIRDNPDVPPTTIVAQFAGKMNQAAWENPVSKMTDMFVIAGTAAQSMLNDLYFD